MKRVTAGRAGQAVFLAHVSGELGLEQGGFCSLAFDNIVTMQPT